MPSTPFKFRKPARLVNRIFVHCSASDHPAHDSAAVIDQWHKQRGWAGIGYHFFIRKSGQLELGRNIEKVPAAQEGNNTGTIAICLHGLAIENFTEAQFATLRTLCGEINEAYAGKVTFHGHCEVAAKTCPVFNYREVLGLLKDGSLRPLNRLRSRTELVDLDTPALAVDTKLELPASSPGAANDFRAMRFGDERPAVGVLQARLAELKYFTGSIDEKFGKLTRDAVLAFQADNDLETDGVVGAATREILAAAKPRVLSQARTFADLSDIASAGSVVAKAVANAQTAGVVLTAGGVVAGLNDMTGIVTQLTGSLGAIGDIIGDLGQWQGVALAAIGLYAVWQSYRAGRAHVADYRSGKTL